MSQGKIFYGLHMYPGVARYVPEKGSPFQVLIKDATIRAMGPSFAGRPVYVQHVDTVPDNVDDMRREADGIVIESFFNTADGNHWTKFVILSEEGERAISQGYRLSNCYRPKRFANGGRWNGLTYDREVTAGEYEHLAIVPDPRYEESIILTPEQFKSYNETKLSELQRLANSNSKEGDDMTGKFNFFKRAKVENAADLADTLVELPTLKREVKITRLLNEVDTGEFLIDVDGRQVSIKDLVTERNKLAADFAELQRLQNEADDERCENEDDDDSMENADEDGDGDDDEDDEEIRKRRKKVDEDNLKNKKKNGKKMKNSRSEDESAGDDIDQESLLEHLENSGDDGKGRRKSEGKDRADRLRNARDRRQEIELPGADTGISCDMVELGKQRYGSTPKK